jgi:1-deoxy-D-xylulose-5-phosphate reductoisomerase
MVKQITVLGSTGSIGRQTLDVVSAHPGEMALFGLSAHRDAKTLIEQARRYHPKVVACAVPLDESMLPEGTQAIIGEDATTRLAAMEQADVVVNGVSGFAALPPLIAALKNGKRVALANKESIVCGKALIDETLRLFGGEILPVDSEQSAIFQCLQNGRREEVSRLILTASGGPFWHWSLRSSNG